MSKQKFSIAGWCLGALMVLQSFLAPAVQAQAVFVRVAPVVKKNLRKPVEQAATLLPYKRIEVSCKVTGFVGEVHVDIGDRVTKGDPLVEVAVPELEAELAAGEARVNSAAADLDKAKANVRLEEIRYNLTRSLFEKKGRTRFQLEEADAQLKLAEASVAAAVAKKAEAEANAQKLRVLVGFGSIKAPFSGIITERKVEPGALVRGGLDGTATGMLTLEHDERLRCRIEIPEQDTRLVLSAHSRGVLGLEITLGASGDKIELPPEKLAGGAAHFSLSLHPRSHHMLSEIELDNRNLKLRPGYFGKARFTFAGGDGPAGSFVIPNTALRAPRKGRPHILVVETASGKAKVRRLDVTAGSTDGREIEIAPIPGEKLEELWVVVRGGADLSGDGTEEVSIGGGK
jgi:RND family efflux transporter MFP subunit